MGATNLVSYGKQLSTVIMMADLDFGTKVEMPAPYKYWYGSSDMAVWRTMR